MWAVTPAENNSNIGRWLKLRPGDPVVFCGGKKAYATSHIALLFRNAPLAERLWGRDSRNGLTWEYMFAVFELRSTDVDLTEVNALIGRQPATPMQGFTVVEGLQAEHLSDLMNLDISPLGDNPSTSNAAAPGGPTDGLRVAGWRREQRALKHHLIELSGGTCALCARSFPSEFLVAAHIKKRQWCTDDERKDFANVGMLACVLGCDSLFEHGYIGIDSVGEVLVSRAVETSPDVSKHVDQHLRNRTIPWWTATREPYFGWHRTHVFLNVADEPV